jgi:hypothetical protein
MPKTPARDDYFTQSFRFTPEQAATIKEEAKRCGSVTAFIRELLDDHRTLYGLPQLQVELLEADMKALKVTSYRDYVRHLLSMRLQALLEERGSAKKPGGKR